MYPSSHLDPRSIDFQDFSHPLYYMDPRLYSTSKNDLKNHQMHREFYTASSIEKRLSSSMTQVLNLKSCDCHFPLVLLYLVRCSTFSHMLSAFFATTVYLVAYVLIVFTKLIHTMIIFTFFLCGPDGRKPIYL